jgi:hypothetical protein
MRTQRSWRETVSGRVLERRMLIALAGLVPVAVLFMAAGRRYGQTATARPTEPPAREEAIMPPGTYAPAVVTYRQAYVTALGALYDDAGGPVSVDESVVRKLSWADYQTYVSAGNRSDMTDPDAIVWVVGFKTTENLDARWHPDGQDYLPPNTTPDPTASLQWADGTWLAYYVIDGASRYVMSRNLVGGGAWLSFDYLASLPILETAVPLPTGMEGGAVRAAGVSAARRTARRRATIAAQRRRPSSRADGGAVECRGRRRAKPWMT